jgi:hypothetical protein
MEGVLLFHYTDGNSVVAQGSIIGIGYYFGAITLDVSG